MVYNIYFIPQTDVSGTLLPKEPYYVTDGGPNDFAVAYFVTEEEAQQFIDNL
jgi:hypothetical protein